MKVFISCPADELRTDAIEFAYDILEEVEIVEDFFNVQNNTLLDLGASLQTLSKCDVIVMCEGWEHNDFCTIQHKCASMYNIEIVYM